ncbi:hypothetical protein F2Q68_00016236 [Brassica cretica]|uniref:Uncharacterized protein n=1 Tax=Brassica cretica TaxID=69181 RepID=A0A8S9HN38_BRACR|nr:hypothetical protein F2Q68_00016236 [Brassica cretica]
MEDMDFGRILIDEATTTSSDMSTEKTIDAAHQTSIDDTPLEADYLTPGKTYSNRPAIKLPKDDTKKSGVSLEYLVLVRQDPFRGTVSEHPHDHIEYLEDMMDDEYNR